MKKILFIALVFILASACKKPVAEVDPNYAGDWSAPGYSLSIGENSVANYVKTDGVPVTISGNAKIKNSKLKILTKKFKVTQAPKLDSTDEWGQNWSMILDDIHFTCTK